MSLKMTIKEFENLSLFSNKNIEKIATNIVNESSNASLVSMYEDTMILLDHNEGQFYSADYNFDAKKLQLTMENFQPIELEKEESTFKENVRDFFESTDYSAEKLSSSYKNSVLEQEKFINDLISESLSTKDFEDLIDYTELSGLSENTELANKDFFKSYKERLETNPISEAKFFNWKNKITVSILESTEKKKLINSSPTEKAMELWKRDSFKTIFNESMKLFIEDVEEGKVKLMEMLEAYPQILMLDNADRQTLFGKAIIANKDLRESLQDLQKGLKVMFEDEDILNLQEMYLSEMEEEEAPAETDAEETDDEEPADDEKEPAELTPEDIQSIADELKKVAEKVEDEKLKEKLDDIIGKLDQSVEEGTRPELIKEAVYLLSL